MGRDTAAPGGMQYGTVNIYMDGFVDGVRYYDNQHHAHVTVLGWNPQARGSSAACGRGRACWRQSAVSLCD